MYDNLLANVPTDLWIGGQWQKSSDGKRFDVCRVRAGLAQEGINVLKQRYSPRKALTQDLTVRDERARRDVSRGVEGQDQHRRES